MNVIISNKYQSMLSSLNIDVIKSLNGEFEADEIVKSFQNFYFQRMILDITAIKDYKDIKNIQKLSISLDMSKIILLLDDSPECTSTEYISKLISMGIYNFTKNAEGIMYLFNNPNSYRDVANLQQLDTPEPEVNEAGGHDNNTFNVQPTRIIGIKSVTKDAGATTLTYLMKRELENNYSVTALEVDKRDFMFFRAKDMISTSSSDILNEVAKANSTSEVILIDLNGSTNAENVCHMVLYLIEPSTIKLNRMMMITPKILKDLSGKPVVLNKSLLTDSDVSDFEYEANLKVFCNIPPLNDRLTNIVEINKLLQKLGFDRQQVIE